MYTANTGHGAYGADTRGTRRTTGLLAVICALFLTLAAFLVVSAPPAARAATATGKGSITVDYADGDTAIAGATVRLYHAAGWTADSTGLTPVTPFDDYRVDWDILDTSAEDYRQLAETLTGYIERDAVKSDATGVTDANGRIVFPGLARGLYLVVIDPVSAHGLDCGASATLAFLPSQADGSSVMDLTLTPKADCTTMPGPPSDTVERTVRKVWKGRDGGDRPTKVAVQLLRDGEVVDTVDLDESNGWTYTWTDLPADHEWRVIEADVPVGYTTLTDRESAEYVITNTITPPDSPPNDDNPPSDTPPGDNPPSETPPTTTPPDILRRTGTDVAVLAATAVAIAGTGLTLLAVNRRLRGSGDRHA